MWSQRFAWAGLSSGTAFAAIAVFTTWYVLFAIAPPLGKVHRPGLPMPALSEVGRSFLGASALVPDLSGVGVSIQRAGFIGYGVAVIIRYPRHGCLSLRLTLRPALLLVLCFVSSSPAYP